MSSIQFQADVARTLTPIVDETYARVCPLDVNITLKSLLDLMRDADLQKRRIFYGQQIRKEDCSEHEALSLVAQRLSPLPDQVHSSNKNIFAKPLPPLSTLPPETRALLDNHMNRYHSVLGLLSEIAELAIIDTMILQELLVHLYTDPTLSDYDDIVNDVKDSICATLSSITGLPNHSLKDDSCRQFEELADMLFYTAQHLLTNNSPDWKGRVSLGDLCKAVIAKLKVRYPNKFSTEQSHNTVRNREAEMSAFYTTISVGAERNDAFLKNEASFDVLELPRPANNDISPQSCNDISPQSYRGVIIAWVDSAWQFTYNDNLYTGFPALNDAADRIDQLMIEPA